jgi:hypothetical protein
MTQEPPSKTPVPITVAIITGFFAIIAAIVSGFSEKIADRVLPTPVSQPVILSSTAGNPPITLTVEGTSQPTFGPQDVTLVSNCDGYNWKTCWIIDDDTKTMTWIGIKDGITEIGQEGIALEKLKSGYTAVVKIDSEMTINICSGSIDGVHLRATCPQILPLASGVHQILSPGNSGGFTIYE